MHYVNECPHKYSCKDMRVRARVCVNPPDEQIKQENGAADDSGSAALLVLWARQRQAIVHVTLMMHYSLKIRDHLLKSSRTVETQMENNSVTADFPTSPVFDVR